MALPSLNVLSLFAGAGGLDLGFRRAVPHARTVCYVEIEAYAAAILAARGEEGSLDLAPVWSSVTTFNGRPWNGVVDCIIGGFPCQDISDAGKRAGFVDADGARTRSGLWFEYARIIDEVQPRFVFIENVAALARRGLDVVLGSLASLGFDAEWGVYSAAEAGAPHRRERLFCLAWKRDMVDDTSERRGEGRSESGLDGGRSTSTGASCGLADADSLPDERRGAASDLPSSSGASQGEGDQRQRSRDPADDREQALADDDGRQGVGSGGLPDGVRAWTEGAEHGRDPHGSSGPAAEMGHTDDFGERQPHDEAASERDGRQGSRSDAGRTSEWRSMGHHHHPGLEGRDGFDDSGERVPWPPGPEDVDGWRRYLERYPDCAPAVEPGVRRRTDGLATGMDRAVCLCNRIDRLRAAGNGVVPAQAELALRDLIERAASGAKFLRASR